MPESLETLKIWSNLSLVTVTNITITHTKKHFTLILPKIKLMVTSPFSFLILLIWVFSLFFLMSLANGLSILFVFSKKQFLVLLIFAIVSFISFSFISDLIFMISFFLLTLGLFCSSFSNWFRCNVMLFIWLFSSFLS